MASAWGGPERVDTQPVHQILTIAVKGLAGGLLVVAFALLSQALAPKRFAGLFSAAPAVAIAGLTVVLLSKGHHDGHQEAVGMVAGVALSAWFAVTAVAALPVLLA